MRKGHRKTIKGPGMRYTRFDYDDGSWRVTFEFNKNNNTTFVLLENPSDENRKWYSVAQMKVHPGKYLFDGSSSGVIVRIENGYEGISIDIVTVTSEGEIGRRSYDVTVKNLFIGATSNDPWYVTDSLKASVPIAIYDAETIFPEITKHIKGKSFGYKYTRNLRKSISTLYQNEGDVRILLTEIENIYRFNKIYVDGMAHRGNMCVCGVTRDGSMCHICNMPSNKHVIGNAFAYADTNGDRIYAVLPEADHNHVNWMYTTGLLISRGDIPLEKPLAFNLVEWEDRSNGFAIDCSGVDDGVFIVLAGNTYFCKFTIKNSKVVDYTENLASHRMYIDGRRYTDLPYITIKNWLIYANSICTISRGKGEGQRRLKDGVSLPKYDINEFSPVGFGKFDEAYMELYHDIMERSNMSVIITRHHGALMNIKKEDR